VGRGVLLDYAAWAASQGVEVSPMTTQKITVSELKKVAEAQNVSLRPNDILFIRSGYIKAISSQQPDASATYTKQTSMPAIGVEAGEEMLRWIWENEFSAVAGDMVAFEAMPFQSADYWLHEWLLAGWGLPIGELFDLETLAAECKRLGKWSFFFSSMPLNVSLYDNILVGVSANFCRFLAVLQVPLTVLPFCDSVT
jgi:hypothetical protein